MINFKKLLCLLCITISIFAQKNIEDIRRDITKVLNKENANALPEFNQFCHDYNYIVTNFFALNNKENLKTHLKYMDSELKVLENTANNPAFISVKNILKELEKNLSGMIKILKQHINSKNHLTLALKLQKYRFLLPNSILNKGEMHILSCLKHRLSC